MIGKVDALIMIWTHGEVKAIVLLESKTFLPVSYFDKRNSCNVRYRNLKKINKKCLKALRFIFFGKC